MRKIRVLYFVPCFGTGGAERLVLDLCRLLDPARFETYVCSYQAGSFEPELKRSGRELFTLMEGDSPRSSSLTKGLSFARRVSKFNRIIRDNEIDIVHTNYIGPLLHTVLCRLTNPRLRWIHTEHNPPNLEIYAPALVNLARPLFRFTDAILGITDAVSRYFLDTVKISPAKVFTVYNGVNVKAISSFQGREGKRRELGFAPADKVIGIVANLRPEKCHADLLQAFALLLGQPGHQNYHLVLAGEGACRDELVQLSDTLGIAGNTRFLGHRLDAHELMSVFDVYCLPSRYEGMPLSVLEAWAAGKPVVATDVRGINALVKHRENGLLVEHGNPGKLAEGLLALLDDDLLAGRLAAAGRELALRECDADDMVRKYESVYEQVVLKRG